MICYEMSNMKALKMKISQKSENLCKLTFSSFFTHKKTCFIALWYYGIAVYAVTSFLTKVCTKWDMSKKSDHGICQITVVREK